jgi:hypothetical protein
MLVVAALILFATRKIARFDGTSRRLSAKTAEISI